MVGKTGDSFSSRLPILGSSLTISPMTPSLVWIVLNLLNKIVFSLSTKNPAGAGFFVDLITNYSVGF